MGLSRDPESRERQLAALAAHRGLSKDPEKRSRQLANLEAGRARRHPPKPVDATKDDTAPAPRRSRAVPAPHTPPPAEPVEAPAEDEPGAGRVMRALGEIFGADED